MKFFRAIGAFFARIGRWIKNTAWVQPLLIVGGIFAIIFSIPYITSWVQSWFSSSGNAAVSYYERYQLTLDGNTDTDTDVESIKTTLAADRLFKYITIDGSNEAYRKEFGDKFFVIFVEDNCDACTTVYNGLDYLEDNWNNTFYFKDQIIDKKSEYYEEFKIYTIFADELDDDDKNCFTEYFYKRWGEGFFTNDSWDTFETPYLTKNDIKVSEKFLPGNMATPTIMLYDRGFDSGIYSQEGYVLSEFEGLNEFVFSVKGSSDYEKASFLWDCWHHQNDFAAKDY